jgi:hypothetical protein
MSAARLSTFSHHEAQPAFSLTQLATTHTENREVACEPWHRGRNHLKMRIAYLLSTQSTREPEVVSGINASIADMDVAICDGGNRHVTCGFDMSTASFWESNQYSFLALQAIRLINCAWSFRMHWFWSTLSLWTAYLWQSETWRCRILRYLIQRSLETIKFFLHQENAFESGSYPVCYQGLGSF